MCFACFFNFCFLAAVAELDSLRVGQWMLSRPIVLGPLLGWLHGDMAMGARLGAALEILCLEELPLGSVVPLNGTLAVAAAVWLGVSTGAPGAALAAGLLVGWLFGPLERLVRRMSNYFGRNEEAALRSGRKAMALLRLWGAVDVHFAAVFVYLFLTLTFLDTEATRLVSLPWAAGFESALAVMPLLGLAALLDALKPRA